MKVFFGLLVVVLCLPAISMAKQGHGPCAKDVETHCASVEPGKGAILKCLHENKDKLSQECKDGQEKMKEAMKDVKEACQDDVVKLCGDVKHGGGRIMKCMKENKDKLSQTCKDEIEKKKEMRKKSRG